MVRRTHDSAGETNLSLTYLVAHGVSPEPLQVDDIQRRNVVRLAPQMLLPKPATPELVVKFK